MNININKWINIKEKQPLLLLLIMFYTITWQWTGYSELNVEYYWQIYK